MAFPRLGGVVALVVEDHADTREMLKEGLAACGAGVLSVASGADALRLVRHVLPDVVIVDIAMPEHDGFWLLREFRTLAGADLVPVIAISAAPLDLLRESVKDAGFALALVKPVDPMTLAGIVADLLHDVELKRQAHGRRRGTARQPEPPVTGRTRIVTLLRSRRGTALCLMCIAKTLGLRETAVRNSSFSARGAPGICERIDRCAECGRRRLVLFAQSFD
jgi:CheY-like chemotaxis protein